MFNTQVNLDRTAYQVLGVSESATQDDIAKAHRALMREFHPDLHPNADQDKAKAVNEAYDTVKNADVRSRYDFTLRDARKTVERETTTAAPVFTAPAASFPKPETKTAFTAAGEQFTFEDARPDTATRFGTSKGRLTIRIIGITGILSSLAAFLPQTPQLGMAYLPVLAFAVSALILLIKRPTALVMAVMFGAIIWPMSLTGLSFFTWFTSGTGVGPFITMTALAVSVGAVVFTKKPAIA